jgi:hypothetical protein
LRDGRQMALALFRDENRESALGLVDTSTSGAELVIEPGSTPITHPAFGLDPPIDLPGRSVDRS